MNYEKVKSLDSQDLWVPDVQRLQELYLELTRLTVVTFTLMVKKLQSRVRKMLLDVVSDIFQKIERDTELLFRNQLLRIQQWQQWNSL